MSMSQAVAAPVPPLIAPADPPLYEILDGQRVELPPMSLRSNAVAGLLLFLLTGFVRQHRLGRVIPEQLVRVSRRRDRQRRPDLVFVSYARWPANQPAANTDPLEVVPELAAAIVSPSNSYREIATKRREYFRAGVQAVWVVAPEEREVHVYSGPKAVHVLTPPDTLDGGEVLPGLAVSLTELFEDAPPPEDDEAP
jgi:Uma2 family endonuclease